MHSNRERERERERKVNEDIKILKRYIEWKYQHKY